MYICFWKLCTEKKKKSLCISKLNLNKCPAVRGLKLQKAIASYAGQAEQTRPQTPADIGLCWTGTGSAEGAYGEHC